MINMAANVIVFTKRMDFKTLLEIECKGLTGFSPVIKDSVEELESFINLGSDIEILVVDDPQDNMMSSINQEGQIKNILVLSDKETTDKKTKSFPTNAVESLVNHLKIILSPNGSRQEGYISIPIDSFIHFKILPFDLYIKISEGKFLKRIPANEDIDESTIEGFKSKGITEMHFERKYNRDFSMMLLNNMINKVESDYTSEDAKNKATNEVFLTTKDIVQSVGLPPKVIQVCESVMERITQDVTTNKDKFSNYITDLKTSSNLNFQFRFIELSSFIATRIVDSLNEGTKDEQIKTIVFASFFSDISLKESSQLDLRSADSIKDLWEEDKKLVSEHPFKASEVISKYKNAPAMAGDIIKQHHGSLDGKSFPKTIAPTLLPLAKCLMAAQELAFNILKNPNTPAIDVIKQVTKKFEGTPIHPYMKIMDDSASKA
jgi:hypothetical protein